MLGREISAGGQHVVKTCSSELNAAAATIKGLFHVVLPAEPCPAMPWAKLSKTLKLDRMPCSTLEFYRLVVFTVKKIRAIA